MPWASPAGRRRLTRGPWPRSTQRAIAPITAPVAVHRGALARNYRDRRRAADERQAPPLGRSGALIVGRRRRSSPSRLIRLVDDSSCPLAGASGWIRATGGFSLRTSRPHHHPAQLRLRHRQAPRLRHQRSPSGAALRYLLATERPARRSWSRCRWRGSPWRPCIVRHRDRAARCDSCSAHSRYLYLCLVGAAVFSLAVPRASLTTLARPAASSVRPTIASGSCSALIHRMSRRSKSASTVQPLVSHELEAAFHPTCLFVWYREANKPNLARSGTLGGNIPQRGSSDPGARPCAQLGPRRRAMSFQLPPVGPRGFSRRRSRVARGGGGPLDRPNDRFGSDISSVSSCSAARSPRSRTRRTM